MIQPVGELREFFQGMRVNCLLFGPHASLPGHLREALAAEGYRMTLLARREDRLRQVGEAIEASDPTSAPPLAIVCDVADEDQVRRAVAEHMAQWGRLDALVNNAGAMLLGTVPFGPIPPGVAAACWVLASVLHLMARRVLRRLTP